MRDKIRFGEQLTTHELEGFSREVEICAGPATTGKSSVLRHMIRKLQAAGDRVAFLKVDVQYAEEDEIFAKEFGIPTRKVYSGELCLRSL